MRKCNVLAGGKTSNVIFMEQIRNACGVYRVLLIIIGSLVIFAVQ